MKTTAILLAILFCASVANAQTQRFVGTDPTEARMVWVSKATQQLVTATLPGEWRIDLTTDGQTIGTGDLTWKFFSTAPLDHHVGQIDFQMDLMVSNYTPMDLDPTPYQYQRAARMDAKIDGDGHYRSLGFESDLNAIDEIDDNISTFYFDFAEFPTSLGIQDRQFPGQPTSPRATLDMYLGALQLEAEPGLTLRSINIDKPRLKLDAVQPEPVSGADLLAIQTSIDGRADFSYTEWSRKFGGVAMASPAVGGVPEPAGVALIVVGFLVLGYYVRQERRECNEPFLH